jgi:predicted Zn-dependent protease
MPNPLRRLVSPARAVTVTGPRYALRWLRGAPRWLQLAVGLVFLAATGTGGYYLLHLRAESQKHAAAAAGWKQFEAAARTLDDAEMRAALDDVLAADPTDVLAASRLRALATGDADASDAAMVYLTLRLNLRASRHADAAREAEKRLAIAPSDWLARCVRVQAALMRGDRDAALRELDALPAPDHPQAGGDIPGLLYAMSLYRALDRDPVPLRTFLQANVLPRLRAESVRGVSAAGKAGLVECYLQAFEPSADVLQPPAVVSAWSPAARLADWAADEAIEAGDAKLLAQLGRLGPRLSVALRFLRRHEQISGEQFADLNRELEARTRRAWRAVRGREPKNAEAYTGLARSHLRSNEYAAARETIVAGLSACGDDPTLALVFSRMLQQEGQPLAAYWGLARSAEQNPNPAVWWALAAEAAVVAERRDLALNACRHVRAIDPNNRWADRTEARLLLDSGDPHKAAQLLLKLDPARLAHDPDAANTYVRALTESGRSERVGPFLDQTAQVAERAGTPQVAVAALRGWVEAPPDPARTGKIIDRADRLLARWPDDADLYRVRAEALYQRATQSEPPWDAVRVHAAIQAYERLRAKLPDDRDAAAHLGWLRVYGDDDPAQALREVAPLRAVEAQLPPARLELLGLIYRRNEMLDAAVRVLTRAVQNPAAPAGCFVQLALALQARGQRAEARAALEAARNRPRSAREQFDYVAAVRGILRGGNR